MTRRSWIPLAAGGGRYCEQVTTFIKTFGTVTASSCTYKEVIRIYILANVSCCKNVAAVIAAFDFCRISNATDEWRETPLSATWLLAKAPQPRPRHRANEGAIAPPVLCYFLRITCFTIKPNLYGVKPIHFLIFCPPRIVFTCRNCFPFRLPQLINTPGIVNVVYFICLANTALHDAP